MRVVEVRRRPRRATRRAPVGEPTGPVLDGDVTLLDVEARRVVGFQVTGLDPWPDAAIFVPVEWEGRRRRPGSRAGRMSGFVYPHRTFGFTPPQPLRRRYTAVLAGLHADHPEAAAWMARLGAAAWAETEQRLPRLAHQHRAGVELVAPQWRFGDAWTSGIINRAAALPYHTDGGNVAGTLSAMYAWRRGCDGGALHLDDYDVWLAIPDRSLTVFSGATIMHGVSPLRLEADGWRYTAVYYVRAGLAQCAGTLEDEVRRAQLMATTHDQAPA